MAIQSRTVKGQPYISGNSLLQDQILLVTSEGGKRTREAAGTVVLVSNIWEDLLSSTGQWKRKKNFFYWEADVTDTTDDRGSDPTIKQKLEAPKPDPELFGFNFEVSTGDSEWAAYWKGKFAKTEGSLYNSTNAVYRKEVILPGTKYIKFGNALSTAQDTTVEGSDGTFTSEEISVNQVTVDMNDSMNLLADPINDNSHIHTDLSDISGLLSSLL